MLATADGLPYAATGLVKEINNPRGYWQHLEPLYERGQKFKAALAASGGPQGLTARKRSSIRWQKFGPTSSPGFIQTSSINCAG